MSELTYRYLWHQVRVEMEDVTWPVAWPISGANHGFDPEVDLNFSVVRISGAGYDVFEGVDLLATVLSPDDAQKVVTARAERRALELLFLKGWSRFRGNLYPGGSTRRDECVLVVAGTKELPVPQGRVALRDGWALNLPVVGYPLVNGVPAELDFQMRPIRLLGIAEWTTDSGHTEPMGEVAAVEAFMGQAAPLLEPLRTTVKTAVDLVCRVPCHRLWANSAENLRAQVKSLVSDPPEG